MFVVGDPRKTGERRRRQAVVRIRVHYAAGVAGNETDSCRPVTQRSNQPDRAEHADFLRATQVVGGHGVDGVLIQALAMDDASQIACSSTAPHLRDVFFRVRPDDKLLRVRSRNCSPGHARIARCPRSRRRMASDSATPPPSANRRYGASTLVSWSGCTASRAGATPRITACSGSWPASLNIHRADIAESAIPEDLLPPRSSISAEYGRRSVSVNREYPRSSPKVTSSRTKSGFTSSSSRSRPPGARHCRRWPSAARTSAVAWITSAASIRSNCPGCMPWASGPLPRRRPGSR